MEKQKELTLLQLAEKEAIEKILVESYYKLKPAAKKLGIGHSTLWRKIQQLGIKTSE